MRSRQRDDAGTIPVRTSSARLDLTSRGGSRDLDDPVHLGYREHGVQGTTLLPSLISLNLQLLPTQAPKVRHTGNDPHAVVTILPFPPTCTPLRNRLHSRNHEIDAAAVRRRNRALAAFSSCI
ncbi:hypothetical protein ACCO45_012965 [Purpureocillium lilacinum]|uniref:Uncharacterized protein n=1 Tax=Purpureocillium lilacinum TaxID=33203 RepID=A0ACC4DA51_PURLI